jgi:hypothetical protein
MGNVTVERAEVEIDRQFARYRELAEKRRVLLGRIEKAESQKQSVKERIFQRVHDEYEKELRRLEDELEPLGKDIEKMRASFRNQIRDIETRSEELRDKLDELSFRSRVGEFEESMLNDKRTPLAEEYERLIQRHREFSDALARIDTGETARHWNEPDREENRLPESATDDGHASSPEKPRLDTPFSEPTTSAEGPTIGLVRAFEGLGSRQDDTSPPPGDPSDEDAFVDPTEWVGEFVPDDPPADPAVTDRHPSAPGNLSKKDTSRHARGDTEHTPDPLSELADPHDELGEEANATCENEDRSGDALPSGLPILTITKGPGAGKSLPLLPMTMTLGREVDNNIELRDVDVARYHARISFEAGKYMIQDLEGSSGTFVDGQRITKAEIYPGAIIRVGGTELKLGLG